MSSSGAIRGAGSAVRIGVDDGGDVVWTKIDGIEQYDFPDQQPPEIDVTHLGSPNDTEEAIPGMKPIAIWSVEVHYKEGTPVEAFLAGLAATHEPMILGLLTAGPDATEKMFGGYVKGFIPKGIGPKNKQVADLNVVVQAQVTG